MIAHRTHVVTAGPARKFARGAHLWLHLACGLACILACSLAAVPAVADVALYQATVPLKSPAEADRAAAFGEALKVAAVRASGRSDAGDSAAIAAAAAKPTTYIQQYSTTADRMLKVGFDGRAMEQLLQQAGLPLWPAERPTTTVYLFVASVGGAARAVTDADRAPEKAEMERAASIRGVPLAWPAGVVDLETARSRTASAGPQSAALLGVPAGAAYEWRFGHAGQSPRVTGSPAVGLGLAANTLAARYAPASTRSQKSVAVQVGGLDDIRGYAALTHYLEGLSLVRSVSLRSLTGSSAQFDLEVRGDLELFRRIVALDGRLAPAAQADGAAADAAAFTWQP